MTRGKRSLLAFLAAGALLAAIGAAVLDDYGVSVDEDAQRGIAETNWRYIADGDELRFRRHNIHNRFYGVAFELPLLLAEKALGLDMSTCSATPQATSSSSPARCAAHSSQGA